MYFLNVHNNTLMLYRTTCDWAFGTAEETATRMLSYPLLVMLTLLDTHNPKHNIDRIREKLG